VPRRYTLCRADQLVEGRGRPARAGPLYLAVFLAEGRIHVVENQCVHLGSPIDGGPVVDGRVICPWHGWTYDLETGGHLTAFGVRPGIRVFAHHIVGGEVIVSLDGDLRD
jgi:nitrite reductase (NADH) small subunit